ncbi:UNVERIFIED_CONTAM: Tuberculostearic acid methyltransferase UfaA1 [Sesamum latifolium]|uniref:Tuberculostearic acid methyltransferase UfaA1 n=1 Tax=Sesamum latifolium TaxID=2727402 RepID=A0AAW2XT71_9LAMI
MRVAVVGAGVSGLTAAYILAKDGAEVVIYEKEDTLGGQAKTVTVNGTPLDLGFMVFSRMGTLQISIPTFITLSVYSQIALKWWQDHSWFYPDTMELFENLGVDRVLSDLSFSVSLDEGQGCEWSTRNGLSSLFAQKKNVLNPYFWNMVREIIKFKNDASAYIEELESNPDINRNETLERYIQSRGYSELFQKAFLIPTCASIWSCSSEVMSFSAYSILSFLHNDPTLQLVGHPHTLTPRWCSQSYVDRVKKELESRGCHIRTNSEVYSVLTNDEDALKMLGKQATYDESRILGAFQYSYSDLFLHHDNNLMPKNPAVWSSRNFLGTLKNKAYITYWLNNLQNIGESAPFFLTLNPPKTPKLTLFKWSTSQPIPSVAASKALHQLNVIQGKRRLWFCGAYQGYGFPEDGVKIEYLKANGNDTIQAGIVAANGLLRKSYTVQKHSKHLVPSSLESGARLLVTRFLERFITTGCLTLLEEGGTIFTFEGTRKKSTLKVTLRVHKPAFYWKVATKADLGFADAYIDGDFSFIDKNEGLLNFFQIFIANTEFDTYISKLSKKRGWWTPLLYTSTIASAKSFFKHVLRQNTIDQARRNISHHYDLSNDLFSLFMDETMSYSCAIFQARISKEHHILEIGCGWGGLAIEVVKRTGCRYTGITLSEKQLQYTESKVKEAGLQDQIEVLLCDYRQLPKSCKYDRIIACEMIEAVGHQYIEEFFRCCDSALAENGILVLQFIAIADEKFDEFTHSAGFIKEYIFPGSWLPSLSRLTSAMAAASRFRLYSLDLEILRHSAINRTTLCLTDVVGACGARNAEAERGCSLPSKDASVGFEIVGEMHGGNENTQRHASREHRYEVPYRASAQKKSERAPTLTCPSSLTAASGRIARPPARLCRLLSASVSSFLRSLRNCSLWGSIPDWSNMSNIAYIDLSYNNLNGTIPASFSKLPR